MTLIPMFAFHENIPALDTEKEIKIIIQNILPMIRIFSRLLDNNEKLHQKKFLDAHFSSAAGKVITGSEFIESKMAECDKYMVILQAGV